MISEEVEAIRQTFRVTLTLSGAAFSLTYLLAGWIGFDRPLQAGLIVTLVCLTMLALGILLIVLTQRFCEVLEVHEPERSAPRPTPRRAMGVFALSQRQDSGLDLYLQRIYREVAPGDRSYVRKGGRSQPPEARQSVAPTVSPNSTGGLKRPVLTPRSEPYRAALVSHPKPHREPRN